MKFYLKYILRVETSNAWKRTRLVLHWLTIPLKLLLIGGLGTYQIIRQAIFTKVRPVPTNLVDKKLAFKTIFNMLPVYKEFGEKELYVNRVPYYQGIDATNHNTDHQCSRQGTYAFLMNQLELGNDAQQNSLLTHIQHKFLVRGYKKNKDNPEIIDFNTTSVSGDMLLGLCLGLWTSDDSAAVEKLDTFFNEMIENDYALLEPAMPEDPLSKEVYEKELKAKGHRAELVKVKSQRAMWQPGLETVGAQALTILAALRVAGKVTNRRHYNDEYKRLFWKYGYGLLSLFPTAFSKSRRGYFNDHNCLVALYLLSTLSKSRLEKLYYKLIMLYVWALSYKWYNGYFTGLVETAHPGTISPAYIEKCKAYLYEALPIDYAQDGKYVEAPEYPVPFNLMNQGEFHPDENPKHCHSRDNHPKTRSGLGFIAHAIMLEKNPKTLLPSKGR